jgi:hypothetical protein
MDAENAGNAHVQRLTHGVHGLGHALAGIGDESRQQSYGAITPMRFGNGLQSLNRAQVVVKNAAPAIHLHVDEARRQKAIDATLLDAGAEILFVR